MTKVKRNGLLVDAGSPRLNDCGRLWLASCKLRALGELIKAQNDETAFIQEDVNHGVGTLLTEVACELDALRERLEDESD